MGLALNVWDALLIALKAITYGATLGAAGSVFFLGYCHSFIDPAARRSIDRLVRISGMLAVSAAGAHLLVTAGSMSGDAADLVNGALLHLVWIGGEGRALGIRTLGIVLVLVLGGSARRPPWGALAGAVLAATSFAWLGHAHAVSPSAIAVLVLGIHLLCVAFWLGALGPLFIVTRREHLPRVAGAVQRFSTVAIIVVGVLVVAGVYLLCVFLKEFSDLWLSVYGRLILTKLAFVAVLLSCAVFNKWHLTRRLNRGDRGAARSLNVSIRFEMLLGTLILIATAVLTTVTGPPALG
jgi:copper resistance protein D